MKFNFSPIHLLMIFTTIIECVSAQPAIPRSGIYKNPEAYVPRPEVKATLITNCTDKINCVGNNPAQYVEMGGAGNAITGIYQTFPSYEGSVIGVQFDAAKSPTAASNPVITIKVYDINVSPLTTSPLSAGVTITLTNTSLVSYSVTFPVPANIAQASNGFGIGITNSGSTSHPRIYFGPTYTTSPYNYSWVTDVSGGTYPYNASVYFATNGAIDALIRPTVTTSLNTSWSVSKISSGCTFPMNFGYSDNSPNPSNYTSYTLICPGGITGTVNFGDGSAPQSPFFGCNHSYSTTGNFVASYTSQYNGWTNNCVQTLTTNILVENPVPSFSYAVNNLNVNFTNTSSGMTNYQWDFGDSNNSVQQNPGIHSYSIAGIYTVVLTGTANCGQVTYSAVVNVGNVGIKENKLSEYRISLYPNPVSERLIITHDKSFEKVELYSSTNGLINTYSIEGEKTEIDISFLPKGIYFIRPKSLQNSTGKCFVKE